MEGTEIWTGPYGVEVNLAGGARSWMAVRVRPREWNIFLDANALQLKTIMNRPIVEQVGFMIH